MADLGDEMMRTILVDCRKHLGLVDLMSMWNIYCGFGYTQRLTSREMHEHNLDLNLSLVRISYQ